MPIDPIIAAGPEWTVAPLAEAAPAAPAGGFADTLSGALSGLGRTQEEAAGAARSLATGEAADPTSVVLALERAQLSMQLASQIRTKAVEALQDVFHTQV